MFFLLSKIYMHAFFYNLYLFSLDTNDCYEGNVLFNNTLNTFDLRLYSIRNIVKGFFYMHHPRQDNTYHSLCYTSCGALTGTRNSSMGHCEGLIQWSIVPYERSYHGATSGSLTTVMKCQ